MTKSIWSVLVVCACMLGCSADNGGTGKESSDSPATGADGNSGKDGDTGGDGNTGNPSGGDGNTGSGDGASGQDGAGDGSSTGDGDMGESGADAGSQGTPSDDPGVAAGVVRCGDTACTAPEICCVSFFGGSNGGFECKEQSACSGGFSAPGTCDGKEDCGGTQACCAKFALTGGSGAFCQDSCGTDSNALCHSDDECGGDQKCIACKPPTGGVVDIVYHLCAMSDQCPSPYMNAM